MPKGKTLEDFATMHDRRGAEMARVRAALKELGDSWEYASEFLARAKLSPAVFGSIRSKIAANIVIVARGNGHGDKRVIIAGTAEFAAKLRAHTS